MIKKLFIYIFTLLGMLLSVHCNDMEYDQESDSFEESALDEVYNTYTGVFSIDGGLTYNLSGKIKVSKTWNTPMYIEPIEVKGNDFTSYNLAEIRTELSYFVDNGSGYSTIEDLPYSVNFYKNGGDIYCEIAVYGEKGYYFRTKLEKSPVITEEYFTTYKGYFIGGLDGLPGHIKITKNASSMILESSVAGYPVSYIKFVDFEFNGGCLVYPGLYLCKNVNGISIEITEELKGYGFQGSTY